MDPATDALEVGAGQSVKHEEAMLRRATSQLHRLPPDPTDLWKPQKKRPRWGLWAGAARTRTADGARCWEGSRQGILARGRRERTTKWTVAGTIASRTNCCADAVTAGAH